MTRPTTTKTKKAAAPVPPTAAVTPYVPGNVYTKAFDWTARLKLPGNHKRVLDFLIRICGRKGHNTCRHEFIAERLGVSAKTVERAVANIEARRFVTVRRRHKQPNHYTIHPDILKVAWTELDRAQALAVIVHLAQTDKMSVMLDRHEHGTCMDPSSAPAGAEARTHVRTYKEETLSAARVSEGNGAVVEQKALICEIVEIRHQLHQNDPERYPKIISPKAYTGKLATKSIAELKTELSQNRNVLENSKKPKSVTGSASGQSIMAQANEIERTTFTGSHEPWFVAWSSLDEPGRIGWRERAEAQLWNDSGWDEWCRQHPDPVEQELGRRRATRNLFRFEWEQLQQYQQDMDKMDTAGPADEVSVDGLESQPGPVVSQPTGTQVMPADTDPDDDQPPTSPKPKRRREQRREHHERRQPPATTASQVSPQHGSLTMPELHEPQTPARNVLPFRRPALSLDPDSRPPMRGPDDG